MIDVQPRFWFRRPVLCCALLLAAVCTIGRSAHAQTTEISSARIGFNQQLKLGTWTPVEVEVSGASGNTQVVVFAPDADGNTVEMPLTSSADAPGRYQGLIQVGRPDGALEIAVRTDGETVTSRQFSAGQSGDAQLQVYRLQTEFWGGLEVRNGFDQAAAAELPVSSSNRDLSHDGAIFLPLSWEQLPVDPDAWDAIDVLVLSGSALAPTEAHNATLVKWVRRGGRLVLLLGGGTEAYLAGPIAGWSPVEVLGVHPPVSRFDSINSLIPGSYRLPPLGIGNAVPGARLSGAAIGTYGGPVIARSDYGAGTVTAFALDFDHRPLSSWESLPQLSRILARPENMAVQKSRRDSDLQATGVTDLGTQLLSGLDQFPEIQRPSFREVLLWTILWMVVLGPADYLVVHRWLKRPQLTWITLPLLIGVASFAAARTATGANRHALTANQVDLLNLDPDLDSIRGESWMSFYSDAAARYNVRAEGTLKGDAARLCWVAKPEEALRGLYRQGGISFASPTYALNADRTEIESLPVRNWSTSAITATWEHSDESIGSLVQPSLRDVGTDRLRGSITHNFNAPLTDWLLMYRGFVYYPQSPAGAITPPTWAPGQEWVIDANTPQTLIAGFLTGRRELVTEDKLQKRESISIRSESYDPLERSPLRLLRTVSFHALAGGPAFTGLTNSALARFDLSRILEMPYGTPDHAVLFARMPSPATRFQIDGQPIAPSDHWTILRATLKVEPRSRPGN